MHNCNKSFTELEIGDNTNSKHGIIVHPTNNLIINKTFQRKIISNKVIIKYNKSTVKVESGYFKISKINCPLPLSGTLPHTPRMLPYLKNRIILHVRDIGYQFLTFLLDNRNI